MFEARDDAISNDAIAELKQMLRGCNQLGLQHCLRGQIGVLHPTLCDSLKQVGLFLLDRPFADRFLVVNRLLLPGQDRQAVRGRVPSIAECGIDRYGGQDLARFDDVSLLDDDFLENTRLAGEDLCSCLRGCDHARDNFRAGILGKGCNDDEHGAQNSETICGERSSFVVRYLNDAVEPSAPMLQSSRPE